MMDLERERAGLDDVSKRMSKTEGPKNASFFLQLGLATKCLAMRCAVGEFE
jgi:hypothetical protein